MTPHPLHIAAAFVGIALWIAAVPLGVLGYHNAVGVLILIAMLLPIGAGTVTGEWPGP